MQEKPEWFKEGAKAPSLQCCMCDSKEHIVIKFPYDDERGFAICEKCNPTHKIEYNEAGCNFVCNICYLDWGFDPDNFTECEGCKKFICRNCESQCEHEDKYGEDHYHCDPCFLKWMDK